AATVIAHGPRLTVDVFRNNGTAFRADEGQHWPQNTAVSGVAAESPGRDRLRHLLHQVTANEDVAQDIAQVSLYSPSEQLAQGLVLIDTPGINTSERRGARHSDLTVSVLHHACDAAIVVIPAAAPAS